MANADGYYDGIPVVELRITNVAAPDPDHLQRYPGALDIDPVAAIEAAQDPQGLVARDPNSATGEAIRAIGYSLAAEAEQAEATRDADLSYQRRHSSGGQSVYGLRLPTERIAQLRRGRGPRRRTECARRAWMIEQLDRAESGFRDPEVDRWERDLRTTTEHLRELLDERPGA